MNRPDNETRINDAVYLEHDNDQDGNLFSARGMQAFDAACLNPATLFAFDFDGTLAPIVDRPDEAFMDPGVLEQLERLAALRPTAIVSGRGLSDLRKRLPISIPYLVGNHGLEGPEDLLPAPERDAKHATMRCSVRSWLETLSTAKLSEEGIAVEPKDFSITLHTRGVPSEQKALAVIDRIVETLQPKPRIIGGKRVVNLMPDDSLNKGTVLLKLMELNKFSQAVFFGDDVTDEDVFAMRDPRILTIRVGVDKTSAARFFLDAQTDIRKALELVIARSHL